MGTHELGTINGRRFTVESGEKGECEITLARVVAELVRQGVTFTSEIESNGEWSITLTGGY
jgi:hypothetical protein